MSEVAPTSLAPLCFCTSAFGAVYVDLAKLLAADLQQFAPNHQFLILTDRPEAFANYANVKAKRHRQRGVQTYHERRFAIQQGLMLATSVMYLDADVRVCAPLPNDLTFLPGLTARSCTALQRHLKKQFDRPPQTAKKQRKYWIIQQMAAKVGISLDAPDLKFINEFLFVVTADQGRELAFFKLWGELAIYADTLGLHKHPTYAMALAAAKTGLPIYRSEMPGFDFFDDRIERCRIQSGKSLPEAKAAYFQTQAQIEYPPRSLGQRAWNRVQKIVALEVHRARVRITAAIAPHQLID